MRSVPRCFAAHEKLNLAKEHFAGSLDSTKGTDKTSDMLWAAKNHQNVATDINSYDKQQYVANQVENKIHGRNWDMTLSGKARRAVTNLPTKLGRDTGQKGKVNGNNNIDEGDRREQGNGARQQQTYGRRTRTTTDNVQANQ